MGDNADAEAAWSPPYQPVAGQRFWLRYIDGRPPIILGIYDQEDDVPGVSSIEVPSGWLSKGAASVTRFLEAVDDLVPGLGDAIDVPWR